VRASSHPDGLPVGEAVATPGFALSARWVIHTVGPNRHAGQTDPALLASCFHRSLDVADELGAASVAFPAVSAGVFGWDADAVASIAVGAVRRWHDERPDAAVRHVQFVLFNNALLEAFTASLAT
jgi:O-acetyl-ADP-ribose deacetylase (regulator of RNase III)